MFEDTSARNQPIEGEVHARPAIKFDWRSEEEAGLLRSLGLQTLEELVSAEYEQLDPIVAQLLRPGETTLLIARQKEGKSTLALQLAVDVANGAPFLGHFETTRQLVLYIDYENRPDRLKERGLDIAKGRALDGVLFKTYVSISDRDVALFNPGLEKLSKIVEQLRPGLLMLDPLRLAVDRDSSDERAAVDALDAVAKLKRGNPNMAVLLIHHLKKTQQENLTADLRTDPRLWVDKIYGSQALLAHAENTWGLEHDNHGYAFGTVARSADSLVLSLEKEPDSQRFKVSDLPSQVANLPFALQEAWGDLPEDFSRTEAIASGIPNNTLDRLIRSTKPIGLLEQNPRTKRYRKTTGSKAGIPGNAAEKA